MKYDKKTIALAIKAGFSGLREYISYFQFGVTLLIYIKLNGWSWWYLLLAPVMLLLMYVHVKFIMPNDMAFTWKIHPFAEKQYKMIEEIKKKVDSLG